MEDRYGEDRYALRFESGERQGETIPIASGGFVIGRRPGSSLQILDGSVSGKHAEIVIDAQGALLRDLGSTNGTRVGSQRVLETRLAHGDQVHFGNVKLTFVDASLAGERSEPAAAGSASPAGQGPAGQGPAGQGKGAVDHADTRTAFTPVAQAGGERIASVSAEWIARSRRRSIAGGIAVLLLALVAGASWYFLRSPEGKRTKARAVVDVPGNLLSSSDSSFEGESDGWAAEPGAPASFLESPLARWSGEVGLEADLARGEWALHRSPEARPGSGRAVEARARLRTDGDARARLGIELASGKEGETAPGPTIAWGPPIGEGGFEEARILAAIPPGYDRARVVVRGTSGGPPSEGGGGTVAFDDAVLVPGAKSSEPLAQVAEHQLFLFGEPPSQAMLFQVDRVLISGLAVLAASEEVALSPKVDEKGVALEIPEIIEEGPDHRLSLRAEPALLEGGIATIGPDGYRTHGVGFEREGVESLLLGAGRALVRLGFDPPADVRSAPEGSGARVEARLGGARAFAIQLDFRAERKAAEDLAHAARKKEKDGDLGGALGLWAELLQGFPYEQNLVQEAEATRGRLIGSGLAEVRGLEADVERARFFRLADLYRQCRARATEIARRYSSSEVEEAAASVVAAIDGELGGLEQDLERSEVARLEAILSVLEASGSSGLAGEVRTYLTERFGETR